MGRNTEIKDNVMETMVKPICLEPSIEASNRFSPASWRLTIFSKTTMASSMMKSYRQGQSQKRKIVQGKLKVIHHNKSANDGT